MTRQVTDQLYIELDYFTPEEYYVYTAEAQSAQSAEFAAICDATLIPGGEEIQGEASLSSEFAITITAVKITDAGSAMSSEFTQTVAISNIYGADLFAFSDAQLAVEVSVIRDYNVSTSSQFDLATDFVRTLVADSFVSAEFAESVQAERSRDFAGQFEAAFSFACEPDGLIKGSSATLSLAFSQTTAVKKTSNVSATLSSVITVNAEITRVTRSITFEEFQGGTRYTPIAIDASTKKFGTGSFDIQTDDAIVQPSSITTPVWVSGTTWKMFNGSYTWTTTNDGVSWSRASNNLSSFASADIANIKYRNSTYITTSGTKLCYSTNGTTWQETAAISGTRTVQAIEYSNSLWIAVVIETTGMFLFTSTDLSTWTQRTSDSSGSYTSVGNIILSTNASVSILSWSATSSGVTSYFTRRSTNGTTWSAITILPSSTGYQPLSISLSGTNAVFAYRQISPLTYYTKTSTDSGATWSSAYNQGSNTIGISGLLYYSNKWYAYNSSEFKTYSSTDNGQTWSDSGLKAIISQATIGSSKIGFRSGEYFYTSADVSAFTRNLLGELENWPGYVEYTDVDVSAWQTVDFWFWSSTTATSDLFNIIDTTNYNFALRVRWINGRISVLYPGMTTLQSQTGLGNSTWHHVRISTNGSDIKLYVNGNVVSGTGVVATATLTRTTINGKFRLANGSSTPGGAKIDELLITDDLLTPIANSSYTVPTTEYTNTDNTQLLLHFNGTFADDNIAPPRTQQGQANLSVIGGFALSAKVTTSADIDLISAFAINALGKVTAQAQANLSAASTVNADVKKIVGFSSNLSSQSTLSVDSDRVRSGSSTLSSLANISAAISVIRDAEILTDSIASQLTAVAKIGDFLVGMDVYFTSEQSAVKTVDPTIVFDETPFTLAALATRAVEAAANINSDFSQVADVNKLTGYSADLAVDTALTSTVEKIQQASSNIASEFALSIDFNEIDDFSAALSSEFVQTVDGLRIRFADSQMTSDTALSADVAKSVEVDAALASATTQLTDAVKIVAPTISTESIATQLTAVAKVGDFLVDMSAEFVQTTTADVIAGSFTPMAADTNLAVDAVVTRSAEAALAVDSELTFLPESVKTYTAALASEFALSATPVKDVEAIALVAAFGELTAEPKVSRTTEVDAAADTTLAADIEVIRGNAATLDSTTSLTAATSVNYDVTLAFTAFNTVLTVGKIIHIDPDLTYVIPRETREYKIIEESRDYRILDESREYII